MLAPGIRPVEHWGRFAATGLAGCEIEGVGVELAWVTPLGGEAILAIVSRVEGSWRRWGDLATGG